MRTHDAWGNACEGGGHALSARLRPPLTDRRQPQLFLRDLADGTVEDTMTPARLAEVFGVAARIDRSADGLALAVTGPA